MAGKKDIIKKLDFIVETLDTAPEEQRLNLVIEILEDPTIKSNNLTGIKEVSAELIDKLRKYNYSYAKEFIKYTLRDKLASFVNADVKNMDKTYSYIIVLRYIKGLFFERSLKGAKDEK